MTRDDNPPLLLHPGNYEFLVVGQAGDEYTVYRSSHRDLTKAEIIARLRGIADRMEQRHR